MELSSREFFIDCLRVMLRPIIKFCLPRSIKAYDVFEAVKVVFIELAEEQLQDAEDRVSISRLSVITGIDRRDVKRIYEQQRPPKKPLNLTSKVVSLWQQDKRFCTKSGKAKVLTSEGRKSEFYALVKSVSTALDPYTILYELERVGAIRRTKRGLRLEKSAFVVRGNVREAVEMMASDVEDLMCTIEENMKLPKEAVPNYHLVTEYDNIVNSAVPQIRKWILKRGTLFHKQLSAFLARFDQDLNPELIGESAGATVLYGGFSLIREETVSQVTT